MILGKHLDDSDKNNRLNFRLFLASRLPKGGQSAGRIAISDSRQQTKPDLSGGCKAKQRRRFDPIKGRRALTGNHFARLGGQQNPV